MTQIVADPVCGKEVDKLRARAVGIFGGVTYYFCSAECKAQFKDPRREPREPQAAPEARPSQQPVSKSPVVSQKPAASQKAAQAPKSEPPPAEVSMTAEPEEDSKVAYAHSRRRRVDSQPSIKVDPSPSVEAEVQAIKGGGRAWLFVILLFAAAGVVLYFAFHR